MSMDLTLPLGGFYHFGYVTRDLDAAIAQLRDQFGLKRYRRKFNAPWMEVIHAWTGSSQIEVAQFGEGAPKMFLDDVPAEPGQLRLQHLGRRIDTLEQWENLERAIEANGFETPMNVSMMDGNLRAIFVDTRKFMGLYSEYLFFSGPALSLNDDVPHND